MNDESLQDFLAAFAMATTPETDEDATVHLVGPQDEDTLAIVAARLEESNEYGVS